MPISHNMSGVESDDVTLRVLLIEHDPACSTRLCQTVASIADLSISINQAASVDVGLELLGRQAFQVVLLDLSLLSGPGTDALSRLQKASVAAAIIVIGDRADETLAYRMLQEGAQDYLVKDEINVFLLRRSIRYAHERKKAELALEQEREFSRILEDTIPDRIYFKDTQSRFLRINRAMAELFHLNDPEEAIGKTDFDMFLPEHAQQAFEDEARVMATGKPLIGIVEKETFPDGTIGWATTTKLPFYDRHHKLIGTFGISRDITAAKEAEEKLKKANLELAQSQQQLMVTLADLQRSHEELKTAQLHLIQAEKMQSLGRLSAGVAHEVKNPLAVIRMGADYLSRVLDPADQEKKATVLEMMDAVKRADEIIRGLLDFSAPHELVLQPSDLHAVIERALALVKHEFHDSIQVVRNFSQNVPVIRMDSQKIEQVFVNLFTNAAHAMAEKGTLTLQTRLHTLLPGQVMQNAGSRQADRLRVGQEIVVIEVMDTGPGLSNDQLARVFDPFYTTKPTGKGTGLGMTVAKSIVELHGGQITVENREPHGAIVRVVLPF